MLSFNLINIVKIDFPMAHHRNEFEHDYVLHVLYILSIQNSSGFYILLKNLIKAIKEGKISKAIGRSIVRRLKKKGIAIDPELLEVINN